MRTSGPRGPVLLHDAWLIEKLAHFDMEQASRRRWRGLRPSGDSGSGAGRIHQRCPQERGTVPTGVYGFLQVRVLDGGGWTVKVAVYGSTRAGGWRAHVSAVV
ncbi:catalase [Burkholderia pseudomultivorans]|uniref:catalase n=1 Tax=Burkholderia pseudomultivorans TaxID=1207504 RepID=UPI0018C8C521